MIIVEVHSKGSKKKRRALWMTKKYISLESKYRIRHVAKQIK